MGGVSLAVLSAFVFGACDDTPQSPVMADDIVELAQATPELSTLTAALVEAELTTALRADGPFTVFAPVNSAFDALGSDVVDALLADENADLLAAVLGFHVVAGAAVMSDDLSDGQMVETLQGDDLTIGVSGGTVTVNGATVTTPDIEAANGVVHLVNAVLVPETDIVDTAVLNGFETLVALVRQAGLESTLRGTNGGDGYTVFAPTEDAFGALASVPTGDDLVDVLTYHVVAGTVEAGDLTDGQVVTTVQGATFTVNIDGTDVTLTDGSGATVNVVATDVSATNGVVHVVDAVLLPN
jgi:uncharacterized surface protein with fasciclin (FAS1) repeats